MLSSYSKIYAIGHPATEVLFRPGMSCPVQIEEKMDGSQISFGTDAETYELFIRSKSVSIIPEDPPKLFGPAVATIIKLHYEHLLRPGATYRAEAICTPRHNTLQYNRIPLGGVILFDVEISPYKFMCHTDRKKEATRLSLECVPVLGVEMSAGLIDLDAILQRESCLGGPSIEGFVVKPVKYDLFGTDGKVVMAKYVSEKFKEKHSKQWKTDNPGRGDVIHNIAMQFRTEAAWEKAVQRRADRGELLNDPKDIGPMLKDMKEDIRTEWRDDIARQLMKWAMNDILRKATAGFPEWYKKKLAARVLFDPEAEAALDAVAVEVIAEIEGNQQ